jgi:flavin-dependent dehydrogenase
MRIDIVGAGPAGLATAINLKDGDTENAFDVHVWDRNPDVRTTPCGEGIDLQKLTLVGHFDSGPYIGKILRGCGVDVPGARRVVVDMPCATMRRSEWLPAMADHATGLGVKFHLDQFLNEQAIRDLPGDVVVGADGPSSRVERIVENQRRFAPATQIRIDDTPDLDDLLVFRWDPEYSLDYSWVFPRGDHTSVGALAPASRAVFEQMRQLAERYGVNGNVVKEESYPIPFGGRRVRQGRYVLVGDAAGVANPLTKGGMAPAFIQSVLLADALREGGLEQYERACAKHPLFSNRSERALAALHRIPMESMKRLLGPAPGVIGTGLGAKMLVGARAARIALSRPQVLGDTVTLLRGLRHALEWGW